MHKCKITIVRSTFIRDYYTVCIETTPDFDISGGCVLEEIKKQDEEGYLVGEWEREVESPEYRVSEIEEVD